MAIKPEDVVFYCEEPLVDYCEREIDERLKKESSKCGVNLPFNYSSTRHDININRGIMQTLVDRYRKAGWKVDVKESFDNKNERGYYLTFL